MVEYPSSKRPKKNPGGATQVKEMAAHSSNKCLQSQVRRNFEKTHRKQDRKVNLPYKPARRRDSFNTVNRNDLNFVRASKTAFKTSQTDSQTLIVAHFCHHVETYGY